MTPEEYLKRPYTFCSVWDEESRTWTGTVKEFPGCIAQGDSWSIVWKLRIAARDWIEAAQDLGQDIPEPAIYCETDKSYTPKTELGQKLMALRNKAIADGMTLLDVDEIMGQTIPEPEVKK